MPKTTHVRRAQQRYEMVPVTDEQGNVIKTPVMDSRTGQQKVSKRGPVFRTTSVQDRSKPLPDLDCDFPGCDIDGGKIKVGTPYKWIAPKSGPYGGVQRNRHEQHPPWNVWEYSYSTSANVARVQSEGEDAISSYEFSAPEDFDDLRDEVVQMAQDLLDEKQESLDNMPEGLAEGSELQEQVEILESWVDEIQNVDAPEYDDTCQECEGTGSVDGEPKFYVVNPDGTRVFEEGFPTQEDADAALRSYLDQHPDDEDEFDVVEESEEVDEDWIEEAKQALVDALGSCEL